MLGVCAAAGLLKPGRVSSARLAMVARALRAVLAVRRVTLLKASLPMMDATNRAGDEPDVLWIMFTLDTARVNTMPPFALHSILHGLV